MENLPNDIEEVMERDGQYIIQAGQRIGTQGAAGLNSQADSHLHFEVRAGRKNYAGDNTVSSSSTALASIIPYGYMKKYSGE